MRPTVHLSSVCSLATLLLVGPGAPALALSAAPESGTCALDGATPVTVVAIGADFAIGLDDGRRVALAGLELPPPLDDAGAVAAVRTRLSDWLLGKQVFVGAFSEKPDRWGLLPARIFAAASEEKMAPLISVGAALLEAGVARFRPDRLAADCVRAYLDAEAIARAEGVGLWAVPTLRPVIVPSEAGDALARRRGMTIVEGVIRSTGATAGAFYLNFGGGKGREFSVVISRRISYKNFPSGFDPAHFVGRRVRVRGLIETGFGPRLEIAYPEEIETVEQP